MREEEAVDDDYRNEEVRRGRMEASAITAIFLYTRTIFSLLITLINEPRHSSAAVNP